MNSSTTADPFAILGVTRDAGEAEVRARYLELVKQYPPDREPEKFREIRSAFEAAQNPLSIALRLVEPPGDEAPQWSAVLQAEQRNPPRLSFDFILSLGNRAPDDSAVPLAPSSRETPESASGCQTGDERTS